MVTKDAMSVVQGVHYQYQTCLQTGSAAFYFGQSGVVLARGSDVPWVSGVMHMMISIILITSGIAGGTMLDNDRLFNCFAA